MPTPRRTARNRARLAKLLGLCKDLPEIDISGELHLSFRVRRRIFAYYLDDHHGDGIVSICCKSTLDRQHDLVERHPDKYYVPAYVGPKGWVALRLDQPRADWNEVVDLLFSAYRLQAPRHLWQ